MLARAAPLAAALAALNLQPALAHQADAPAAIAAPFTLRGVEIEGSGLPPADLRAAFAPFLGKTLDAAARQRLVAAIDAVYQASDVALFAIAAPAERRLDGVLRLQVVEGHISAAVVRRRVGARMKKRIGALLAPVVAERPLRKSTLQRQISLIREIPGFDPEIGFERAADLAAPRLVVDGQTHRVQLGLGANTRGTAFLGRNQGQVDLIANSLALGGDQARLSYAQPIGRNDFRSINLGYAAPLTDDGLTLSLLAGKLTTQPRDIPLKGRSTNAAAQLSWAAVRSFGAALTLTSGVDAVNSDNVFLGYAFSSERTRALRLGAIYTRQGARSATQAVANFGAGLPDLGARTLDPAASETDFRKLNFRLVDNRQLASSLVWRTNLAAQVTGDRLPGSEQMAAGGEAFGRAFETAIISGDSGYAASGELAWRPADLPSRLAGSEVYGFVDGARLSYHGRHGIPATDRRLASTGAGLRVRAGKRSIAQLEAVRGLNNPVAYANREVWRLTVSLRSVMF